MNPGDCINIPAGVKYWHGAAPDSWFSHLAIEVSGENGLNEWLEDFTRENKIKLIDINKDLSEDYHLKYEYTNDGLHYNDEGTKILFNNLK